MSNQLQIQRCQKCGDDIYNQGASSICGTCAELGEQVYASQTADDWDYDGVYDELGNPDKHDYPGEDNE
jgi:hypothetical protein